MADAPGALARKHLHVSETLLEFAIDDDGKPLSKLLLSKALLDGASKLDDKHLQKLTAKQDAEFFEENPLALRSQDGVRVISLAEEGDDPSLCSSRKATSPCCLKAASPR